MLSPCRFSRIRFSGTMGCSVSRPVSSHRLQQRLEIRTVAQTPQRLKQDCGRGRSESARYTQYATKRCYIVGNPFTTMYDRIAERLSPTSIYHTHFFWNFLITSFRKPLGPSRQFWTIPDRSKFFSYTIILAYWAHWYMYRC